MSRSNHDQLLPSVADRLRSIEDAIRDIVSQSRHCTIAIRKTDGDIGRIKWAVVSRARFVITSACQARRMKMQSVDGRDGDISCSDVVLMRIREARRVLDQARQLSRKLDQFKLEKRDLVRRHSDLLLTAKEKIFQWKDARSTAAIDFST